MINITYRSVGELKEYAKNPRKNDPAVDKVAESIKEFGFKNPIIIDVNDIIIAGHTRLKAAKKLGLKEVPTIKVTDLSEQQIKAFRIADNKVSEFAEWDDELLFQELGDIPEIDMTKFGIEIIKGDGFDTEFALPDGDKEPIQSLTFTLSDQQVQEIEALLKEAKEGNNVETFGNTNSNGNALYRVFKEWEMLKK